MTNLEMLLKKHDLPLPMPYDSQYFEEYKARYQAFAQAVIEDYKASLVPVAYVDKNSSGQISMKSYYNDYFDMSKFVGISLYTLGETE